MVFFVQVEKTSFVFPPGITLHTTGIGAIIWKNINLTTRNAMSKQKLTTTININNPLKVEINIK